MRKGYEYPIAQLLIPDASTVPGLEEALKPKKRQSLPPYCLACGEPVVKGAGGCIHRQSKAERLHVLAQILSDDCS